MAVVMVVVGCVVLVVGSMCVCECAGGWVGGDNGGCVLWGLTNLVACEIDRPHLCALIEAIDRHHGIVTKHQRLNSWCVPQPIQVSCARSPNTKAMLAPQFLAT
jgi:hypothetical protein